jgi:UDP-2,3-diacylglucosamine pyrophosphatase LpxH
VSTLVVSDLHLGARSGVDVLRADRAQAALLAAVDGADELIVAGDLLELRDGPVDEALAAARPLLKAVGEAMVGRRVVLVPGNHDHQLLAGWRAERPRKLGVEQLLEPERASAYAGRIAGWLAPAQCVVAYPGLRVGEDVYVTHGHYLDRHITVPALEPLALRVAERLLRRRGDELEGVDGYEAVVAPVYAAAFELAQSAPAPRRDDGGGAATLSARAYRALARDGAGSRPLHHRLAGRVGLPALVAALNAAGLGPLRAELSGPRMRRSALEAMGEVVARLDVGARHVVFGHTHRAGPLPSDDRGEWVTASGARLHNCGSWVRERFLGGPAPQRSPYRAGAAVLLQGGGAPEVRHLLDEAGTAPTVNRRSPA